MIFNCLRILTRAFVYISYFDAARWRADTEITQKSSSAASMLLSSMVHTSEHKVVDDNTAFVHGGLVVEKVRMCVWQEANDCRRPWQSSVRKTCMRERQHLLLCQSMLRRVGQGSFYMVDLIRPVRRRCERLFCYAQKHADAQVEHFGRDTCVSHH